MFLKTLVTAGILLVGIFPSGAQDYVASRETPRPVTREFRGAWSACIYHIDWPSRSGLSPAAQRAELVRMLQMMSRLRMNALIFQVRPHADAMYQSRYEPWSPWLTGTMGRSPGYDPLAFCIKEAHKRGIEVHAWFNPFRALPNADMPTSRQHITRTNPRWIKRFKSYKWMDISQPLARQRALDVIGDVVKRYDIDGVHIDDYFYPYPDVDKSGKPKQIFPDGKSPRQRRAYVDAFVQQMYGMVKKSKPWVRVGISPFGIWRPGVPRGTEAGIDSYRHLSADSRKWLQKGWCDYMMPQLYWRIQGPQSYTKLLTWWRQQGSRPVWPGIATSRIKSYEDPGRRAKEIENQVSLSRTIGRNWVGHCHWSIKALLQNRDGITRQLSKRAYREAALVPPMPWLDRTALPQPQLRTGKKGKGVRLQWAAVPGASKYAVQARYGKRWMTVAVLPSAQRFIDFSTLPDAVAVSSVNRFGTTSKAAVLKKR